MRAAVEEPDVVQAAALVEAFELKMANGLIMQVYDSLGHLYIIPPYLINEAEHYGEKKEAEPLKCPKAKVEIIIRSAKNGDFPMKVDNYTSLKEVKELYTKEHELVRLFFNGKELLDQNQLAHYSIASGMVIQALISQKS